MLTSKPQKKKRGRQPPPYGLRVCPLCGLKLRLIKDDFYGHLLSCSCGWKE